MGDDLRWQMEGDFFISVIMKTFHVCPPKKCKQLISSVIAHTTQDKAEQSPSLNTGLNKSIKEIIIQVMFRNSESQVLDLLQFGDVEKHNTSSPFPRVGSQGCGRQL